MNHEICTTSGRMPYVAETDQTAVISLMQDIIKVPFSWHVRTNHEKMYLEKTLQAGLVTQCGV